MQYTSVNSGVNIPARLSLHSCVFRCDLADMCANCIRSYSSQAWVLIYGQCLCTQAQESPAESRYAASEASTASVAEDTSLDEEVHSRAASNSQASSSRAAGPGSSRLSSIGLTSYFKPGRPGGGGDPFSPAVQQQQQLPPRSRQGSSVKGAPSHRRGGSWAASDVVSDLIDTVRLRLVVLITCHLHSIWD